MGKIFISHSSANNAEALAIGDWLAEQGWTDVFLDLDPRRGLVAGDRWQAALKAAAEQCELILILISPDWAKSKWCLAEFLLAKQMNKQILGVVVKPTPLDDLPVELTAEWQLVDLGADDVAWSVTLTPPRHPREETVNFSGTGLARLRSGLEKAGLDATTFLWPPTSDPSRAPYRGLLPLDQDDAGIFFGRDGAIVLTLDALRGLREAAAPRFVTILGASGAGKSSFLRAGILPRLDRDSLHFNVLPIIRPEGAVLSGEHGFVAMLERALKARGMTRNRADIRDAIAAGAIGIAPLLRDLAATLDSGDAGMKADPTLVIAIDQAEELLSGDAAETGAFLALLAELSKTDDPALIVIFTVRSDSFDPLQSRAELASTQPHHLIDLPPIAAGSFGEIIRGPARRLSAAGRKLRIDETLVDALLDDIEAGGTKDALPLLAFTLERLYTDYGADGDLQLAEYEKLGRIRGAIEAAVEQALTRADGNAAIPRDRVARLALLRRGLIPWLAGIDPATGSPRRRVARLAEVPPEARPLIELMVEQRLLATDVDSATKERIIEPAHEALLRQWGALDGWLLEDSADLGTIEALRRAASEWDANARAAEFIIHRGARLAATEQIAGEEIFATYLTSIDRAYLAAARSLEDEARRRARAARTRWTIAASLAGVVLVAGLTAGWFIWSEGEAARTAARVNFDLARAEAALREGHPEAAAGFALSAYETTPDTASRSAALGAALAISPNLIGMVAVEARVIDAQFLDAGVAAVLAADGSVTLVNPASREIIRRVDLPSNPAPVALLPLGGGDALVALNDSSLMRLDGTTFAAATGHAVFDAAASADGRVIAMLGLIGEVVVRDCRSLPCVDTIIEAAQPAVAAAVKPDGTTVALLSSDGTLAVHRGDDYAVVAQSIATAVTGALAWGAGDTLSLSGQDATLTYDAATGEETTGGKALATGKLAAWSPGGEALAVSCGGTSLCIETVAGAQVARLDGHLQPVTSLGWSADGQRLLSAASGEPVRLWSITEDTSIAFNRRSPDGQPLTALAVDGPRGLVAAGDQRGTLWTWSGEGAATAHRLPEGRTISSVAILADGRVAAVHQNQAVAVWTAGSATPDHVVRLDNLSYSRIAALTGDIRAAVPLSDKSMLVLSGDQLREARVAPDSAPLDQWGLAAAPAPNSVFVSYSDGSIRRRDLGAGGEGVVVFDAATSLCGAQPTTDNNGSRSLDVSADSRWLAATRSDDRVIVHNLADPARPVCLMLPARDSKTVAFSPDSTRLAVLSATDRLYLFDLSRPDEPILFGVPAVPEAAPTRTNLRTTSWLAWQDDQTLALSTAAGSVRSIGLDPARWRARVDTLIGAP